MTYTVNSASNSLAVLQHIREVLPIALPFYPKYQLGTRVKTIQKNGNIVFTSVGIICGFQYYCHPDFSSQWFYTVANESGLLFREDGSSSPYDLDEIETFDESEVFVLD
jgi:hypothetical protein